jgi:hypothetical protein
MHSALSSPNPRSGSAPSAVASRLIHASLLAFVVGALLVWLVRADALPYAVISMSAYAAAIVAFLGGIHWGIAFAQPSAPTASFVWGVVPVLVSAIAAIMPAHAGLVILGTMLLVCYAVDRRLYAAQGLRAWLTLRFRLSAVGAFCCFLAAAGA